MRFLRSPKGNQEGEGQMAKEKSPLGDSFCADRGSLEGQMSKFFQVGARDSHFYTPVAHSSLVCRSKR